MFGISVGRLGGSVTAGGSAAAPAVTFDPSHTEADIALSNGNLTATATANASAGGQVTRATVGHSTGQYYYECTVVTQAGNFNGIGVAADTLDTSVDGNFLDETSANGGNAYWNDGYFAGAGVGPTYTSGDVICVAVDIGAQKMWARKNNGSWLPSGDPAAGTGGASLAVLTTPLYPAVEPDANGNAVTMNFGATAYAQTPPLNYLNWDGTNA